MFRLENASQSSIGDKSYAEVPKSGGKPSSSAAKAGGRSLLSGTVDRNNPQLNIFGELFPVAPELKLESVVATIVVKAPFSVHDVVALNK